MARIVERTASFIAELALRRIQIVRQFSVEDLTKAPIISSLLAFIRYASASCLKANN